MSSRRSAAAQPKPAAKAVQPKRAAKPAVVAAKTKSNDLSEAALQLAAQIERSLAAGETDALSEEALQVLMAASCNLYSAQVEAGQQHLPLKPLGVPPTAVMSTASGILRAANLAVFELGMWQSWTGR
ncbi:MAG: hypothetical protein WAM77_17725 [Xanthobacteraceae bacterium]